MSDRAKELLDQWIEGLHTTGITAADNLEARSIAETAKEELGQDGVSPDELETAADGNLVEYIRNALAPPSDDD